MVTDGVKAKESNFVVPRFVLFLTVPLLSAISVGVSAESKDLPELETITVVGQTPVSGVGLALKRLPFAVQQALAQDLEDSQKLDITEYANSRMASVSLNSAQNNPLQPDLQFRGFTASPLLGLPQGVTVYQNGARINEPLGDSVNYDLLPLSAVDSMVLHSGANPLFGLNTLGGALSLTMKNGFSYEGHSIDISGGDWERVEGGIQSGGNNGTWGYYVNIDYFDEEGWRDLSDSEAINGYASVSWRDGETSGLNLSYQQGESDLIGNGASPIGLIEIDREAIFTAPDVTENDMNMVTLDGFHFISEHVQMAFSTLYRENTTDSFNGDGSEFEECEFSGGAIALLEEADDIEDELEDQLGIELDDICEGEAPAITNFDQLEDFIENAALLSGLDPEDFELEDVSDELSGTGIISDEAINNISRRQQDSQGFDVQLTSLHSLFGQENHFVFGAAYFKGESTFNSVTELAELDPVTRSTEGLGTGTFVDEEATSIRAETETYSLYVTNTISVSETVAVTLAGRYNDTDVSLRDRSGERPELNGDHNFSRFNPTVGLSVAINPESNFFASYSQSSRAPTPIELACNEGVFEVAQQFAIERGDDPDDIEFECRLPNAFLADPPLEQVVAKSFELGARGLVGGIGFSLGVFRTDNEDDILFQSTGRATGLFANVDKTRRKGVEAQLNGEYRQIDWALSYSFIDASFETDFAVLSPNHEFADEEGEIQVGKGDRIPGIPEHQFKLAASIPVTSAIRLSAEVLYNSNQVLRGDESNQLDKVDGYALVNFGAQVKATEKLSVFARVTNVFDEEYENFGLLGEDPDEVLDLDNDEPVFFGVGAPRAAWIGLRFRL